MQSARSPGQQAAVLPAVCKLDFHHDADSKMGLKHLSKDNHNTAAWVQMCGMVAAMACA